MEKSLIYRYEKIIRELANLIVARIDDKPFREEIMKRLKFSNTNDWNTLCSLLDVLGDTELAKENFLKYGLGGPTKYTDYGEEYLRLYGITNAVYLQKSALIYFLELVKLDGKKALIKKIEESKILQLRHKVGAHTIDFLDNGVKNPHQIQRAFINSGVIKLSDSKNEFEEYDLKRELADFNKLAEDILIKATEKFINTVLKNGGAKKEEFVNKLNTVKAAQNGNLVFWSEQDDDHFIVNVKS